METEFRDTLLPMLETFGQGEGMEVLMPNQREPKEVVTHLQCDVLPIEPKTPHVCGGSFIREWLLQVTVRQQLDTSENIATDIVDKLQLLFPLFQFVNGAVYKFKSMTPVTVAKSFQVGAWNETPATIKFQAFS